MKSKTLANVNPFLASNGAERRVATCVASSTAVETGESVAKIEMKLKKKRSTRRSPAKSA